MEHSTQQHSFAASLKRREADTTAHQDANASLRVADRRRDEPCEAAVADGRWRRKKADDNTQRRNI